MRHLVLVEHLQPRDGLPDQGEREDGAEGDAQAVPTSAHPPHRPRSGMVSMYARPTAMTMSQALKTALMSQNVPDGGTGVPSQSREWEFLPGSASR